MRYERGAARQRGGSAVRGCLVAVLVYMVLAVAVGVVTTMMNLNGGWP